MSESNSEKLEQRVEKIETTWKDWEYRLQRVEESVGEFREFLKNHVLDLQQLKEKVHRLKIHVDSRVITRLPSWTPEEMAAYERLRERRLDEILQ